ncbi:MAG TPA: tetratricopeptide repeat protein, partial [Candidatus Acidoferrales bacterium]|nr:tetratricopeptide repeat protein [Candidatus Acidoferrales bacterium]
RRKKLITCVALCTANLVVLLAPRACAGLNLHVGAQQTQTPNGAAAEPEVEMRVGTDLTRQGRFLEAIPHLVAAQGHVNDEYAVNFNLALCYVASHQPKLAIPILANLRDQGQATSDVWNLLAQAYVGDEQSQKAFEAFEKAAALRPESEKLYALVADACLDQQDYDLGLKVVDAGLQKLPESARLHYQRGVFLTALDRFDMAKRDFDLASQSAPGTDIGYLAAAHEDLLEWNTTDAIRVAREAIASGKDNYILLSILGEALIRSGINPGDAGFAEAKGALEKSAAERPGYSRSHISLGKLYLMEDRADDAIAQLDKARDLDPRNPAVYSYLASAYRSKGDMQHAKEMLATLARLNQEQVTAIRDSGTTTGEHRGNVNGVRNQ